MENKNTDNELIAHFMKWKGYPKYKELSFEMIMPAVQKAAKIIQKNGWIPDESFGYTPIQELYDLPVYTPIKKIRRKLINFIIWYNNQKP